ncbi:hypothetical protein V6N12_053106 [Hibiscus sabdariffa]|uniref:Uncharacterized protein n=1 Tax=Hibiscus sabdariffa TaxID=183260 RepID=A0ABR2D7D8_9ROSI
MALRNGGLPCRGIMVKSSNSRHLRPSGFSWVPPYIYVSLTVGLKSLRLLQTIQFYVDMICVSVNGVKLEGKYIAIFLEVLFPGALVAFDYYLLLALPRLTALRVYGACIWHIAV